MTEITKPQSATLQPQNRTVVKFLRGLDLSGIDLKKHMTAEEAKDDSVISSMQRLQWIKLRKVNLTNENLPFDLKDLERLENLDLSNNKIESIANFSKSIHDWSTIFPNLKVLNLRKNKINSQPGSIPFGIFQSPALQVIDLSSNDLKRTPDGLEAAKSLLVLNLSDNNLTTISPDLFVQCTELMFLDLSGNQLETLPAQLRRCCDLRQLILSRNPLKHAQLRSIAALKNLEILKLSATERRMDNFPTEIERLEKIIELDISSNFLVKIPPPILTLRSLKKLDLSSNNLKDLSSLTDNWPNLEYLSLAYNNLTHLPTGITRLTSLRKLYINNNQLNFSGIPSSIGKLVDLEIFNASNNKLENIPEGLCRCGHLKRLYLNSNELVTLPDAIHYLIESLEIFEFESNPNLKFPPKPQELKKGAGIAYYNIDFSLDSHLQAMRGKAAENHDPTKQAKDTAARLRRLRRRKADGNTTSTTCVLEGMKRIANEKEALLKKRELAAEEEVKQVAAKKWHESLNKPDLDYSQIFDDDVGTSIGLEMWEIDEFYPKRVEEDVLQGRLFDGDCYIVLHTKDGQVNMKDDMNNNKPWKIYYWIGSKASLDKRACAAMHAVNLRNLLGAECRTKREEQDEESDEFLVLFDHSLLVLEGSRGETGFLTIKEDDVFIRMYRLFGKERNLKIVNMPCSYKSLDPKFVYFLDGVSRLYIWIGAKSRLMIQTKARLMAEKIATKERRGAALIQIEKQGYESNEFWAVIMHRWLPPPIKLPDGAVEASDATKKATKVETSKESMNYPPPPEVTDFPEIIPEHISDDWELPKPILYDIQLGKGYLELPQVDISITGLTKDLLRSKNVYLLDSGGELFVWMGDKAAKFLRSAGCKLAQELNDIMPRGCFGGADSNLFNMEEKMFLMINQQNFSRICQDAESQIFKAQFQGWESALAVDFTRTAESVSRRGVDMKEILEKDKMKVDLRALLTPREKPLEWDEGLQLMHDLNDELVDGPAEFPSIRDSDIVANLADQSGQQKNSLQQFIIMGKKWQLVEPRWFGHFFSQDSYIIISRSWEFEDDEDDAQSKESIRAKRSVTPDSQDESQSSTQNDGYYEDESQRTKTTVIFWQGRETSDLAWVTFNLSVRKDIESRLSKNPDDPSRPYAVIFKHFHQQQEDIDFMAYFQRQMVIHIGRYKDRYSEDKADTVQMYHLRANGNPICTRCVEIKPSVMALNSYFSYMVKIPMKMAKEWNESTSRRPSITKSSAKSLVYIWLGDQVNSGDETLMEHIADRTYTKDEGDIFVISEGGENEIFWKALGARKTYDRSAEYMHHARLFRLSNEAGYFMASEKCSDFCQDDLADDHVMLLDTGAQIFLWLGKRTSDVEVKLGLQAAKLYKENCIRVQPGRPRQLKLTAKNAEPHSFRRCFHGWGSYKAVKEWSG